MKATEITGKGKQGKILLINAAVVAAAAAIVIGLVWARGGPGPSQQPLLIGVPWAFTGIIEAVDSSPSTAQEQVALEVALAAGPHPAEAAEFFESFVQESPSSAWSPGLRAELARFYFEGGAYT